MLGETFECTYGLTENPNTMRGVKPVFHVTDSGSCSRLRFDFLTLCSTRNQVPPVVRCR